MDRPLGKKFDPRPKRIQRSDGSYWVANPCVSEHFLTKEIGNLDRQKTQYSARQNREQRELQKELQTIKTTKSYRPGPGYFRRRGSKQHSMVENSFSDMIEKFNKRRVEQNFVNNLMKQRRESMYNTANDSKRCRSTNHLWDGAAKTQVDLLHLDLQTNTDDEDVNSTSFSDANYPSQIGVKKPLRRGKSKRENVYIVSSNDCLSDKSGSGTPEETTIKLVASINRKPSYVTDREKPRFKTVSQQSTRSHNKSKSKAKPRSAANLWGLVREKALEPGDLKKLNAKQQEQVKQVGPLDENSKSYLDKPTTDDQKLMEKEQETTTAAGNINDKGKTNVVDKGGVNYDQESNNSFSNSEGKLTEKQKTPRKNKFLKKSKKTETYSKEDPVSNSHNLKSKVESPKPVKSSIASPRPKSAKGRSRKSTVNSKNHSETIKNALVTIVNEMKDIIQDDLDTSIENRNKSPNGLLTIPVNDDHASLNNFLCSELSEHETSKMDNRKLSEFDLSIDEHFLENRKSPGKQDGGFGSRDTKTKGRVIDGEMIFNESSRNSSDSPRTSANSCRSYKTDDSEKLRQSKMNDELWDDVRKCRYLRGYDPPEMIMPANVNVFVFGKDENDIIEEIRLEKQNEHTQQINQK